MNTITFGDFQPVKSSVAVAGPKNLSAQEIEEVNGGFPWLAFAAFGISGVAVAAIGFGVAYYLYRRP